MPDLTSKSVCGKKLKGLGKKSGLSPDSDNDKKDESIDTTAENRELRGSAQRHVHRLFGKKKFATLSVSFNKLKHKAERDSTGDGLWRKRGDSWRKRRSLLSSGRAGSGTSSPRRVPSSSSLTSLSDTDAGKMPSQSRNLLKVHVCCVYLYCVCVQDKLAAVFVVESFIS